MTLPRAISRSFTPRFLNPPAPSESKNPPQKAHEKKFNSRLQRSMPRVKVPKAKRARGFRIDHGARRTAAHFPSQQQTNCHNVTNYKDSVLARISGVRQEKLIESLKIRLFFFLPRQSAVTPFAEFVEIKFFLQYLFPQEFDPIDQARTRGLTTLSPIERCRMHAEKHR